MALSLGIPFPSEAEALCKQAQLERDWTPTERLRALEDLLDAVEKLSRAGGLHEQEQARHTQNEQAWQHQMTEFIKNHGPHR